MKVVNPYLVGVIFDPFLFLGDDEKNELGLIEVGAEEEIRAVLKRLVVPYFFSLGEGDREKIKLSFGFFLKNDKEVFMNILGSCHCPLSELDPPIRIFEILWDELFEGEMLGDYFTENYSVVRNFSAPNLIKRGISN